MFYTFFTAHDSQISQFLQFLHVDPPKWLADGSADATELTFYAGGTLG